MTTNNDKPTISKKENVVVVSKMEIPNNGTWYTERAFSNLKKENKRLKALLKKTLHCIEYKKNRSTGNDYEELSGFLRKIQEACNE